MKILILGAGAVGGYFGALLLNKGVDVTFLVREKRALNLRENGLTVESPLGNIKASPKVITSLNKDDNDYDLAVISCKAYALEDAMQTLSTLSPSTYILPLLNGLSHYPSLKSVFGSQRILGGFAHLSTTLNEDGSVTHFNESQNLTMGALEPEQQPFIDFVRNELSEVAPFMVFSNSIRMDIYKKLVFIATAASATCFMNNTMGEIASTPRGAKLIADCFEVNCQAAAFAGFKLDTAWKDMTRKKLLDPHSPMTSSLLRDMRAGKQVEISILEDMLEKCNKAGLNNELLLSAQQVLKKYQLQSST